MMYGDNKAKYVSQGQVSCVRERWTPLRAGSVNLNNRAKVRIFIRGNIGATVAIAYANINDDGTFTTPTTSVAQTTVFAGGSTWVEPISHRVTVYGRLLRKAGFTDNSVKVIVTEYGT